MLMFALGCEEAANGDDDDGGASNGDVEPYLGSWYLTGTASTTCSDGTRDAQTLTGTVEFERGRGSDLLRTVTGGSCAEFPLDVNASNATLSTDVVCPVDGARRSTVTAWQVTLGTDESSATETGSAKTVFAPPETGTCTTIYATTLVKSD